MLIQLQNFYITNVLNDTLFILYLTTLLVDILTGNAVALYQRKWNSRTGINGTIRHVAVFSVLVLLMPIISYVTGIEMIANGVLIYVITQYTVSVLENLSALGFDLSSVFTVYFEFLNNHNKQDKQNDKKGD